MLRCSNCARPVLLLSPSQVLAVESDPARFAYLCVYCSGLVRDERPAAA
jgi:DNA-directed RNA polymerase subunit RPC12/RpoP